MNTNKNATFVAYSGTNPQIKALVGQKGFEIEILADNRLQIRRNSLVITTSPVLATKTARAFEYEITTYRTASRTEYEFSVVAKNALSGIFKHY